MLSVFAVAIIVTSVTLITNASEYLKLYSEILQDFFLHYFSYEQNQG